MLDEATEKCFLAILEEELIPAMGCTEPIALAYAAAKMREVLGKQPERIHTACSGNMIKNVRCVKIPNSGGMVGIEAAVTLGAFGGDATRGMEVLESVSEQNRLDARAFVAEKRCEVSFLDSDIALHFWVEGSAGDDTVEVETRCSHMGIVRMTKNGVDVFRDDVLSSDESAADRSRLNIRSIKQFADEVEMEKIRPLYDQVTTKNMDIAYEGMSSRFGVGIGRVVMESDPNSLLNRMKAYTAAASEARMGGCDLPVIITSGSGNQGISSTVPVIIYCREKMLPKDQMYRALAMSSLLTIFQKEFIGKLSAFCGAVSATCAAGAAITYLEGGTIEQIEATIDNTLAITPGMICDGAKISCAAKISTGLDAAMLAHELAMHAQVYEANTGILRGDADETISCVGYIGRVGMRETDKEILRKMLE